MGPGEHRPHDEEYWTAPWSTALFAGDLFEAIPFGDQPTTLYQADDGKHFVGEVGFGYGLLTTPTCDMADQSGEGETAHPFRVLASFAQVSSPMSCLPSHHVVSPSFDPRPAAISRSSSRPGAGSPSMPRSCRCKSAAKRSCAPPLGLQADTTAICTRSRGNDW